MYVARNQYLERLKSARTNGLIKIVMNCLAEEILVLSPISSVGARRGRRIYLSYIYTPVIYWTHGNMKAFLVNLIVIVVGK